GIEQQHMAAGGDFTVLLAVLGAHCVAPVVDSDDRVASSTGCLAGRETFLGIDPRIDDCVRSATRTSRSFPPSCVQPSVCWFESSPRLPHLRPPVSKRRTHHFRALFPCRRNSAFHCVTVEESCEGSVDRVRRMPELRYPAAERLPVTETLHGRVIEDPYRWLEDPTSAETKEWATAQDTLYAAASRDYESRDSFAEQVQALLGAGGVGAPVWRGQRCFFTRRTADQEHAVLYVRDGEADERALIDPGALDPEGLTTLD